MFAAVSTPGGLNSWWTKRSSGEARTGAEYELWFAPTHDWRAVVSRCIPGLEFELQITRADEDWLGTRVGFCLEPSESLTLVRFHHSGWRQGNDHFRTSCYCWAMYLRVLRRYLECGETVPYEGRLDA